MKHLAPIAVVVAALAAHPASARQSSVNVPAGTTADAAIVLARQTRTSIVITDPKIANRQVNRLRGRMGADEAVRRLAKEARARAVPSGPSAWRIVPAASSKQRTGHSAGTAAPPRPARIARAPAQKPAPPVIIVVNASKRDTQLQELPGQVSILDGKSLEFGGVGGTEKVSQRVATVSSTYLGSGRNKLFIRGIADSSFTGPTQATVGQYLGDLRLSYNAPDPDLRLSDMDRVEVLEGPQGTLYGAGSLGGIIRMVPNRPIIGVTSVAGTVGGAFTQHGQPGADANLTFNLPIIQDRVALRATFDATSQGGYINKPMLDRSDVNRTDIIGGRIITRLELSPDWIVDIVGLVQTTDSADSQYADRGGLPLTSSARVQEGSNTDYTHGQFVLSGRFGEALFRSTTGIAWQNLQERYDATIPDGPERLFIQNNETRMIANETRIWRPLGTRYGWLTGFSLTDNRTGVERSLGQPDSNVGLTQLSDLASTTGVLNTISEATVYGEGSLRLTDWLLATAGARYTHMWLGGIGKDVPLFLAIAGADITASRTESAFLPSISLLADLMPLGSFYVRYQEGFRPGGLAIEGDFVRRFRNDRAATIEFGTRLGTAGHGDFDLSASISYTRWRDIQADFIDIAGLPSTANIGDGRVWTASLAGSVRVTPNIRLNGGLSINESRVDAPIIETFARARQVPNIARFAGRIGADFAWPINGELDLSAQSWISYVGKSRLGVGPELGEPQGDYLDSGLTMRVGRDNFGISLAIANVFDAQGNRFALGTPFAIGREQVTPLRPRTIRFGFDTSF